MDTEIAVNNNEFLDNFSENFNSALNVDLNSAEVNKKLDFAIEQLDAGYSELEVRSSMILSEIIGNIVVVYMPDDQISNYWWEDITNFNEALKRYRGM